MGKMKISTKPWNWRGQESGDSALKLIKRDNAYASSYVVLTQKGIEAISKNHLVKF